MRVRRDVVEQVFVPGDPRVSQLPAGLSAQQFLEYLGRAPAPVPDRQAPGDGMPAVSLLVLDALADDAETVYSMRNCGEVEPSGLAVIGEHFLREALRALLDDGLIEVEQEVLELDEYRLLVRRPPGPLPTSDQDLRRYSYVMTPSGWETWRAGNEQLDAYADAHPLMPDRLKR